MSNAHPYIWCNLLSAAPNTIILPSLESGVEGYFKYSKWVEFYIDAMPYPFVMIVVAVYPFSSNDGNV